MIFGEFYSGIYDQRGLWKRLQLLANALTSRPTLGQHVFHISIQLAKLQHVAKLTQLLGPILDRITNIRSLSLPIHKATASLLDNHRFKHLAMDLRVEEAYDGILSLDEITLVWSPIRSDQPYMYQRLDELQLGRLEIGPCRLNYQHTIKLLRRFRTLDVVAFCEVSLGDCASLSCESKVAGIVEALSSSKNHLTTLDLHIKGCRNCRSESTRISSFEPFSILKDLEVNEYDLAADVVFPASLTRVMFVDWERAPHFPFTRNLPNKSFPLRLESITSLSRHPDILRQILTETWASRGVEIQFHRYDDSLPSGTFRTPESPS